jgi:hypothetical protein
LLTLARRGHRSQDDQWSGCANFSLPLSEQRGYRPRPVISRGTPGFSRQRSVRATGPNDASVESHTCMTLGSERGPARRGFACLIVRTFQCAWPAEAPIGRTVAWHGEQASPTAPPDARAGRGPGARRGRQQALAFPGRKRESPRWCDVRSQVVRCGRLAGGGPDGCFQVAAVARGGGARSCRRAPLSGLVFPASSTRLRSWCARSAWNGLLWRMSEGSARRPLLFLGRFKPRQHSRRPGWVGSLVASGT